MPDLIASSEGSQQKIQMGSRISLHFALLMPGGEEIDTTRRGKPAALTLGDGNLLPGFESALLGLSAGDDAQLIVPAEQAFGERVEANVRLLAKTLFAEFTSEEPLEPGLVVSFQAPDGELPGVVKAREGMEEAVAENSLSSSMSIEAIACIDGSYVVYESSKNSLLTMTLLATSTIWCSLS